MKTGTKRYGIDELAELGGVSRRTVRYYVQEALIPAPLGVGRGRHYGPEHLERLLKVKALQEQGRSLDEIRRILDGTAGPSERDSSAPAVERSLWRRFTVAPGVEIHVNSEVRLPPPGRLQELADWCRTNFAGATGKDEEDNG